MFVLPNGKKFEEWDLFNAMMSNDENVSFFIDLEKGEICELEKSSHEALAKLELIQQSSRYLSIPRIRSETKYSELKSFNQTMFKYEYPEAGKKLEKAIKEGLDFAECLKIVEGADKYEIDGWNQWSIDGAPGDEMHEWVESLAPGVVIEDDWGLDDDCELCKLLKNGAHTVGDFREAAAKEERKKKGQDPQNGADGDLKNKKNKK